MTRVAARWPSPLPPWPYSLPSGPSRSSTRPLTVLFPTDIHHPSQVFGLLRSHLPSTVRSASHSSSHLILSVPSSSITIACPLLRRDKPYTSVSHCQAAHPVPSLPFLTTSTVYSTQRLRVCCAPLPDMGLTVFLSWCYPVDRLTEMRRSPEASPLDPRSQSPFEEYPSPKAVPRLRGLLPSCCWVCPWSFRRNGLQSRPWLPSLPVTDVQNTPPTGVRDDLTPKPRNHLPKQT